MSAIEQYEQLLRRLHRLIAAGKCDSEEADQVRDQMDEPWSQLTPAERRTMQQLSADLNNGTEGN